MDRQRFIEAAPKYYALAIVAYLRNSNETLAYKSGIQEHYTTGNEFNGYAYLDLDDIFELGTRVAVELGLVEIIKDDFGPDLFRLSEQSHEIWDNLINDREGIYFKYWSAGDKRWSWLTSALESIKKKYQELDIGSADDIDVDTDWAPIPLERGDDKLKVVIEEIDRVTEELRGDNGYGAKHPEEKAFVFDKLRAASKRLKEETQISWMYVREFAVEPLMILTRRFSGAAIGVAAVAAKEAIKEWLKSKGVSILHDILR